MNDTKTDFYDMGDADLWSMEAIRLYRTSGRSAEQVVPGGCWKPSVGQPWVSLPSQPFSVSISRGRFEV